MAKFTKMKKIVALGLGVGSGVAVYWYTWKSSFSNQPKVLNSWTTDHIVSPCGVWDFNWDHRDPKSLVKTIKVNATPEEENKYNSKVETYTPKANRHIFLIRHGQYNLNGATDAERILTDLGRKQAQYTGERLSSLKLPWNEITFSTLSRAQETGNIIMKSLPKQEITHCALICEGAPVPPEPPIGHWKPEAYFFQDGARIEAGFRKYFHRADAEQKTDSYTLIVCHANVIRYFVCRALQLPPEAWLRLSLNHSSITWLSINPSGRVVLRTLGDSGHMPPEYITSR